MAPKFGLDNGSSSNFDYTCTSNHEANSSGPPEATTTMPGQVNHGAGSQPEQEGCRVNVSEHPTDHTRIGSELSGSAARSGSGAEDRRVQAETNNECH
ncbi:hypothetical protein Ddye_028024 [Dipteronia dyeriana]|uniref:Uncharacterized protein n=1 Tax=Dipteronia dyeriana TaxID=168575 RepID=A0AAD9WQQ7_9ROSI|nr:hypothetical protein Ddye_028024 [Dipteronia dyeriana]